MLSNYLAMEWIIEWIWLYVTCVPTKARKGWWDESDDTALQGQKMDILTLSIWSRTRFLSGTEAHHSISSLLVGGEKHFVSFEHEYLSGRQTGELRCDRHTALTTTPGPRLTLQWKKEQPFIAWQNYTLKHRAGRNISKSVVVEIKMCLFVNCCV